MTPATKSPSKPAKKPRSETPPERTMTAFRLDVDQLAEISRRAKAYRMTRTEYIIAAALGELPDEKNETVNRLEAIERRLDRLEDPSVGG
jgi:hypothetical protein